MGKNNQWLLKAPVSCFMCKTLKFSEFSKFALNLTTGEPICWAEGECMGIVDFFDEQATANDCLQLCNSTLGCRWFTFYSPSSECLLYQTCLSIDASCKDCISGERRCIDDSISSTSSSVSTTTVTTPMPAGTFYVMFCSNLLLFFLNSLWCLNFFYKTCFDLAFYPF